MKNARTGVALKGMLAATAAMLGVQAMAATQTLQASFVDGLTDITAQLLEVSQFDPSLGVLNSVTLSFEGVIRVSSSVANNSAALRLTNVPITLRAGFQAALSGGDPAALPGVVDLVAPGTVLGTRTFVSLGPGARTNTGPFTLAVDPAANVFHFSTPAELGAFAGHGTIGYLFSTQSSASTVPRFTTVSAAATATSSATLKIQYDYSPQTTPVPEPGSGALMLAGLAAGAWMLRRPPRASAAPRG